MRVPFDREQIEQAVGVFMQSGNVIELRVPINKQRTDSGYFDNPAKLIEAAVKASGTAPGIYCTLNPVNPALLARAANRLQKYAKQTTGDVDIVRRLRLLFDIDPNRPAGISSSDREHAAALNTAQNMRDDLTEQAGWPTPLLGDSGNGSQLVYAVDLPNDPPSTDLIKRVLAGAAERFNRDDVHVDQSVFNSARISKLFGTLAAKGDSTAERPHRVARILECPASLIPVTLEQLQRLAIPPEPTTQTADKKQWANGTNDGFDIARWIAQHHLDVAEPVPYRGGRKWTFTACPFDAGHIGKDAALFEHANGKLGFYCFHNSCAGKDWHAVRELIEPGQMRWNGQATNASAGQQPGGSTTGNNSTGTPHNERGSTSEPKPLGPAAYHGIAGEIVKAIMPHTEADPAAVLMQLLVAFGSIVGRSRCFRAGADRHHSNMNAAVVGQSAKARKGSSWSPVKNVCCSVDSHWGKHCIQSGLTSGEGLIWSVRDRVESKEEIRDKKTHEVSNEICVRDSGVADKRLLVVESEFASVLRAMERQGNTLSAVMRQAWDDGDLRILSKNSPVKATGAHISVIAHITQSELLKYLTMSESGNGFGNRFLWVYAKRSKLLPDGGEFGKIDWAPIWRRLVSVIDLARDAGEMTRDHDATEKWHSEYWRLTADRPGLFGSVTSRAEAQTLRLSMVYALLDGSPVVRLEHLTAALEVWRYCEDSARFIFGDRTGDGVADQILDALRVNPAGMTREEINNNVFGRNKPSPEIERGLNALRQLGLATMHEEPTGGRPKQRWSATAV